MSDLNDEEYKSFEDIKKIFKKLRKSNCKD